MPELSLTRQFLNPATALAEVELGSGQVVADFGSGAIGHFVFPAARLVGPGGKVYAIDIQKSALSMIESNMRLQNIHNIIPLWGDMERRGGVQVPDGTFELSLVINNLFAVKAKETFLQEVRRTTKPRGKVLVIDWLKSPVPVGPSLEQRLAASEVQELFQQQGFSLDHSFTPGPYHWGLVFRRSA